MANMRFAVGIRRKSWAPYNESLKKIPLTFHRSRPIPRIPPLSHDPHRHSHRTPLSLTCRLLLVVTADPQHLSHIAVLQVIRSDVRSRTSRPRRNDRHSEHRRPSPIGSQGRVLRDLHQSGRRSIPV